MWLVIPGVEYSCRQELRNGVDTDFLNKEAWKYKERIREEEGKKKGKSSEE